MWPGHFFTIVLFIWVINTNSIPGVLISHFKSFLLEFLKAINVLYYNLISFWKKKIICVFRNYKRFVALNSNKAYYEKQTKILELIFSLNISSDFFYHNTHVSRSKI